MADEKKTDEKTETKEHEFENVVTVEEAGPCKKKIIIEVPAEAIKAAMDEQYKELKAETIVPGFRRGRAPIRLIEKRFGSDVSKQVKLKLMADASDRAMKDNEIDVLGDPDIDHDSVELPETGPMKFEFEVEVRPDFELPKLEGIEVEKPTMEIADKQIDEQITQMRQRAGMWEPKDGKVEPDDQIVADVVLVIEGVEEHEKRDNIEIFVRERGFVAAVPVEGLDKLLEGAGQGDVKKTTVDVPETYFNEEYRGKKVEIEIAVKDVKELVPAELNGDFFKRFGVEDVEDLKDSLREAHASQAEQLARNEMTDQIYQYLREHTRLKLPASIVADQSRRILQRQYTNLLLRSTPKEEIDQQMQQLQASSEEQARDQLKLFFIMDKISEKFKIEVGDEEVNGYVAQVAAQRGRRPEKMREELARDGSLTEFTLQIREQKCIEKILESAKITEVDASKSKKAKKKTEKKVEKAEKKAEKKVEKKVEKKAEKDKKAESKKAAESVKKGREKTQARRTAPAGSSPAKSAKKAVKKMDKKGK